jgi:uncharacterized protein DUF3786
VNNSPSSVPRSHVPSPQEAYLKAAALGFETLARQPDEQLAWLGAQRSGGGWRVAVLNDSFEVDLSDQRIVTSAGNLVGPAWAILVLHYLSLVDRPEARPPAITFADLKESRSYAGVYDARVVKRLCATAGRNAETIQAAAGNLGGRPTDGGDLAFDFTPFPRFTVRLLWHAPDDEFPPSATLLLPENIEAYFCAEDVVVLSEGLVARLGGRPF